MGVPKFYRWISERYPKINQVITDNALLPEFDHLYLDMNGIIHGCTHPNHLDISDTLSEKEMMLGIMHYLDRIITQIVKPKVSVFLAIDGVAPRAKLNQQRSRRFRSAKDRLEAMKQEKNKTGIVTDEEAMFDSNCITPGTDFMTRVSKTIHYFIRKKLKEDVAWRHLKIIFSGPEIPGEGEHKIMEYIRDMRSQPNYPPNTRHCMYGQDADLIMLALVTHEPHFTLLREIVDFGMGGGGFKNENAFKAVTKFTKTSDFQLLHCSILREYIALEFRPSEDPTSLDLERMIDDWIFLTFLVGNDFLPHMASLDIGDGAFDLLFNTYKEQRTLWGKGEYLTLEGEIVDMSRLEKYLSIIGAAENDILEAREAADAKYIQKRRKWDKRDGKAAGPSDEELMAMEQNQQSNYMNMIDSIISKHGVTGNFVDGWSIPSPEKKDFKGRYYFEKLKFTPLDIDKHHALRKSYIEGLMWCLAYYTKGCISWGWFFPYHYAPMISDLVNLQNMSQKITLDMGAPLRPFEQLMGCLPPASSSLVPRSYRKLMCSNDSPIIQFYPMNFEVDMNGKKNPWEGINLLPFIDVTLLKESIKISCPDDLLTPEERSRNSTGNVYMFSYDAAIDDTVPSCNRDLGIPDIIRCHSRVDIFKRRESMLSPFKSHLIPGTRIPFPGFPSLNVLPFRSHELMSIGVNCFGLPSKYPTMVLTLHTIPHVHGAEFIASKILGKSLFINWPLMHEAKVVAVSDAECIVRLVKGKQKVRTFTDKECDEWEAESSTIAAQYMSGFGIPGSGGIDIGEIKFRLKMLPLQGMKTNSTDGSTQKVFGTEEADVPLQMVLLHNPAPDPRFNARGPMTIHDRFPADSQIIITKGKYRGCVGSVQGVLEDDLLGVSVTVIPPEPPFGLAIAKSIQESYISANEIANILRLNPVIVAKVTASMYFNPGNFDLGLNFAYKGRFYVLGYSRRRFLGNEKGRRISAKADAWKTGDSVLVVGSKRHSAGETGDNQSVGNYIWEYSPKAVRLIAAYMQQFPALFTAIQKAPNERSYDAKVLGPNGSQNLGKIREWLDNVETAKLPRIPCTTQAMPHSAVKAVQHAADMRLSQLDKSGPLKVAHVKVPSSALYREGSTAVVDVLQSSDNNSLHPELGIRVVNLCANGVPFGARGTVVAVHDEISGCVEVVMDEEFIGGSTLQGSCSHFRGKLCVWNHLLTISSSDSKDVVDNMIPPQSVRGTVEDSVTATAHNKESSSSGQKSEPKEWTGDSKSSDAVSPKRSTLRPDGVSSQQLGKHGAWREALGPDKSKIGFHEVRCGSSNGLELWRTRLQSGSDGNEKIIEAKPLTIKIENAAGLKALLGVSPDSKVNNTLELKAMLGVRTDDKSKMLKNVLGVAVSASNITTLKSGEQVESNVGDAANLKAMLGIQTDDKSKLLKSVLGVGLKSPSYSTVKGPESMEAEENEKTDERPVDVFSWQRASMELNNIHNYDHHNDPSMKKASDVLLQMVTPIPLPLPPPLFVPLPQPLLYASAKPSFNFAYVPQGQEVKETEISVTVPLSPPQATSLYHAVPGNNNNPFHTVHASEKDWNNHASTDLVSSKEQASSQALEGKKALSTALSMKQELVPTVTIRASTNKNKKVT